MASNATTQLRLTLGAVRLEYEGRDEFLKSEVPPLVQAMDRLVTSRLIVPCNVLQAAIQDSFTSQKDIDDAIVGMKNDLDSMSELGEAESLRLQIAMDRLSKLMSTLSNILKKISDTTDSIAANLSSFGERAARVRACALHLKYGMRVLRCGISIRPMTAVGHFRQIDTLPTPSACPSLR